VPGIASRLRCVRLAGHSRPVTEDEAETVAKLATAMGQSVNTRQLYGPVMRYGRLFTPGTEIPAVADQRNSGYPGKNAYRLALDSGLLYAEGYARVNGRITTYSAWCLDGETVVHPELSRPGTAFFGVALRPDYVRRVYDSHPDNDHPQGLSCQPHPGDAAAPAWVLDELLRFGDRRPQNPDPYLRPLAQPPAMDEGPPG
jgi:hypothetical protein